MPELALPRLLILSDRRLSEAHGRSLVETVASAVEGGGRAILLREKDLPSERRLELGRALMEVIEPVGGMLGVASDIPLALALGARWVHLAAADPIPADAPLPLGRSCHDPDEVLTSLAANVSYVVLSPVFTPSSKPAAPTLGFSGLTSLTARAAGTRVFALGGIGTARVRECRDAGAYGVAVMSAVMGAADPAATAAALLRELERR
ncbi:MAG TPA: thiamine phosphate synthase [Candidatus Sulfotelmatobacter sp.]|nr:thiamine phosphate synthase [Candidatus Sulfotelmatobacter sp.]